MSVCDLTSTEGTESTPARVLTWQEADRLSPYDAIERWRRHEPAALHEDDHEHHLEELALMTVSAEWLARWQPIAMHRAICAGATSQQVAEAAGMGVRRAFERWERWAGIQRQSIVAGRPGVAEVDYQVVRACFAEDGTIS
jgi:hypothetical protein